MSKHTNIIDVKITDFSKDGHGIGLWESKEKQPKYVEVPFSIPGDEVQTKLCKQKKGIYHSLPIQWKNFSEKRIKPICKHFGYCGGCKWQQMDYNDQLKQKEFWIRQFLEPYLHDDTVWFSTIPCLPPWQYRNKMEFTFSSDKLGQRYLGLIINGSKGHVFQIEECHLIHSWVIEAVKTVCQWWKDSGLDAYHVFTDKGSLRTLTLREGIRTGDRMVILTVSGNTDYPISKMQLNEFVSGLRSSIEPKESHQKLSIFLRIQQISKGKKTQFYEMLLYGPDHIREILTIEQRDGSKKILQFHISPTAFFQPNTKQAEKLYSRVVQLTQIKQGAIVYDLYCGTGTLGICMASIAKEVIGIELSPESALDARENVKLNHLSNVSILTGDVGKLLSTLVEKEQDHPDIVMVDPPRAGLDPKALKQVLNIRAPQIIYVSCNPETQANNLKIFTQGGYRLKFVQPIDQFPQTAHCENIVVLEC